MKLIIAGSRSVTDPAVLERAVAEWNGEQVGAGWSIEEVVCGMARGADLLGRDWAKKHLIRVVEFPADWETYGKRAGILRNTRMAEYGDALLALWDGNSTGTAHMISVMRLLGKPAFIYRIPTPEAT